MHFKTLDVKISEGVGAITLNRPDRLNAIDLTMRHEFRQLSEVLAYDEAIRVVVFTGSGRAFCVGADVSFFEQDWSGPVFRAYSRILTNFFDELEHLEKPILASINGLCVGGGLELALACDLRVASEDARFGFPENNIGVLPGVGGCSRLVKTVGLGKAKELVLCGELIDAHEAKAIGLVNQVVKAAELHERTAALTSQLLKKAPIALGVAKRVIWHCANVDMQTGRALESFGQSILIETADHQEGLKAFREKRPPRFGGG